MSMTSEALMKEIHQIIEESVEWAIRLVGPKSDRRSPSTLSDEDKAALRRIALNDQTEQALRRLIAEVGRSVAFGVFSTIDGVAVREGLELPDLALVERDTGQSLSEGFLHDDFSEYTPD